MDKVEQKINEFETDENLNIKSYKAGMLQNTFEWYNLLKMGDDTKEEIIEIMRQSMEDMLTEFND